MHEDPTPRYAAAAQWSPSTFEERGATTAFTTPLLVGSRVRFDEQNGLALLIPHFAETRSVYVVPWGSLTTVVSMSLHDQSLHEAIELARAVDPVSMRKEAMNVAAYGLAGPEVQAAAISAQAEERQDKDEMLCLLLLVLLRDLKLDTTHFMSLKMADRGAVGRIRSAFHQAVRPLGLDGEEIHANLACLATSISALGLAGVGQPGRLRRLLSELIDFKSDMENRFANKASEAEAAFCFAGEVAGHTITLAESILGNLDLGLSNLMEMLKDWNTKFAENKRLIGRLSWLLDGWDYALGFAAGISEWRGPEIWTNLDALIRMLPIVPRNEQTEQDKSGIRFAELVQRRRVTTAEDWRTGRIDMELKRRLEGAKATAFSKTAACRA